MADDPKQTSGNPAFHRPGSPATTLASRALSVVAGRGPRALREAQPGLIDEMLVAALRGDLTQDNEVLSHLEDAGCGDDDIADLYIPAVARRLGDMWVDDKLSFAEVTIASSRLQFLLRAVQTPDAEEPSADIEGPTVLTLVPQGIQHTLGALVLSGQMRRRGLSVHLLVGVISDELTIALQKRPCDAVFISLAADHALDSARQLVDAVRANGWHRAPVVVGGAVLNRNGIDAETLIDRTGADFATSDLDEAIKLCGLKRPHRTSPPGRSRG
jgi:methylmalonyl-CoA mutase cobalamin-binding subunit